MSYVTEREKEIRADYAIVKFWSLIDLARGYLRVMVLRTRLGLEDYSFKIRTSMPLWIMFKYEG